MENCNTLFKMIQKTVTRIEVPEKWNAADDYSSHRPMLFLALEKTDGGVVELGCGEGSTRLISQKCKKQNKGFESYETLDLFACRFKNITTKINSYNELLLAPGMSILFVDSAPGEGRKTLVEKYDNSFEVIILHDTELGAQAIYGITDTLNSFKYRLNYYPEGMPGTTALSNSIDVTKWV